jgi:hypothetical protein
MRGKQLMLSAAVLASFFCVSAMAGPITITEGPFTGTVVGAVDTLLDEQQGPFVRGAGSTAGETAWVNGQIADQATYLMKSATVPMFATNQAGVYAFQLMDAPTHFLVKNAILRCLFINEGLTQWGVIRTGGIDPRINLPAKTISHVSEFMVASFTTPAEEVPAAGSAWLLLTGLAGLKRVRTGSKRTASQAPDR